jgi:hypothetical protein
VMMVVQQSCSGYACAGVAPSVAPHFRWQTCITQGLHALRMHVEQHVQSHAGV